MERMRLKSHHDAASRMGGFHRRYQRTHVTGFVCDIADGKRLIGSVVEDISEKGFRIRNLDDTFDAEKLFYQVVVSGDGDHYKILAKPCWQREQDGVVEVGFKIIDSPWEWTELIMGTLAADEPDLEIFGNA